MLGLGYRIGGCILLALALLVVFLSPFGQRLERDFGLASLYYMRGPVEVPVEAIVIGLDRNSIEWLELHATDLGAVSGSLADCMTPYAARQLLGIRDVSGVPRGVHACLVRELAARGARVIVFDILFRVPIPEEDAGFAAEIAAAGQVVLFERIRTDVGKVGSADNLLMRQGPRAIFAEAARETALFLLNAPTGNIAEGYFRELDEFPDLGVMPEVVWRHYTGRPTLDARGDAGVQPIWLYGPAKTVRTYSVRDVFNDGGNNPLPADLSSVAVFIGVSDPNQPGTKDHYKIPIAGANANDIGGVELAATAFLNLLHGHGMTRLDGIAAAALVFGFVLGLALAVRILPGRWWSAGIVSLVVLYLALCWVLFTQGYLWMPVAVPVFLGGPAAALLGLASRYAFAKALVMRLTPKQVASALLEGSVVGRRAVRTEQATVMFTDLVGSTKMGDELSNVDYAAMMNRYYDAAESAIVANEGMIVEFMGDGILSVWSESIAGPRHASLACNAAVALCDKMSNPGQSGVNAGEVALRLRIGINSGMTATGDVGAKDRYNYKALGDTVNVAARLEQYGREVDDQTDDVILVSHVTRAMSDLPDGRFEDLGAVALRGKKFPVGVARLRLQKVSDEN